MLRHCGSVTIVGVSIMRIRPLVLLLDRIAIARRIGGWLGELRFRAWKKRNPDKPFSQFYVDDVISRIGRGKGHPTLGSRGYVRANARTVSWTLESFAERGRDQWAYYSRVTGLSADKKCVDFGCGSLRVGQHAIRELEPGHYWGLDVTDAFVKTGMEMLDPALVKAKNPRFSVISEQSIDDVRGWEPQGIFANAVLQHVPPSELKPFFQRIARIMGPGAVAAIVFIADVDISRVKAMSWAYPDEVLTSAVLEADRKLKAKCLPIEGGDANAFKSGRRLLRIEKSG